MTANNRFLDDLSKLMTNAMGVAQGAKDEAQTAFNSWIDRWLADRDFVTREEFEAVREMAIKARTENAELRARLDALEGKGVVSVTPTGPLGGGTAETGGDQG
ncbi:accessory factor UbiK family protein [Paracoccus sp. PS-1]|uniref:accessory factor UbiK family protein n=1 Tax=unclassified Paracoccus (in: a-proteobacteria) TaxID=2688777 RepID=UPI00048C9F72|nr:MULTISPECIES: accessory factor UbiK family protein [unclassified Paracoccus (in: a-proteobacteria)]MDQ7263589.1 accessory factor UbiK family protein [Paracoccus sp. PS1]